MRMEKFLPVLAAAAFTLAVPAAPGAEHHARGQEFPSRLPVVTIVADGAPEAQEPSLPGGGDESLTAPMVHSGGYSWSPDGIAPYATRPVGAGPAPSPPRNYCPFDHVRYFCYTVQRDWRRNNCWPQPFLPADRVAARASFETMVARGRERQNTFGDFHFEEEGRRLSDAGEAKLRTILAEASTTYRTVFVSGTASPEVTAARIEAIQRRIAALDPYDPPHVFETGMSPAASSAEHADRMLRRFRDSMPDPRIPRHMGAEMMH